MLKLISQRRGQHRRTRERKERFGWLRTSWSYVRSYSSLGYLRINLWHRLMEAIHTAIWTINCISGPRDYRRQMVDRLHLNEGFSVIRGDFLCTYLFPRLWRGPGQCGLSSLQKMELGTGQSGGCTRQPGPEPNF